MAETIINTFYIPISEPDEESITSLLRQADVFTPTFIVDDEDIYDLILYRRQALDFNTKTKLFVDRNVFTRWISLIRGTPTDAMHSRAAAVMAFAQCANMLIEPNLSLYEYADSHGNDAANAELQLFRIADNINPQRWVP